MHKLRKPVSKEIEQIAANLPIKLVPSITRMWRTGQQLIDRGVKEINGKKVNPRQEYQVETTKQVSVDHAKRMKDAYRESGAQGLIDYTKPLLSA